MPALVIMLVGVLGACDLLQEDQDLEKKPVSIAYVEWARAVAITHVAEAILEDEGFEVTLNSVSSADMWQSVADGTADAHLAAWLPNTHSAFYGPEGDFTDQVEDLGANYRDARLGLVVPSYVDADSIADLDAAKADFESEIQGIDPGAGMMATTEDMITDDTYGLGDWTLLDVDEDDDGAEIMTTALGTAIDAEESIVVTGWKPHWKFGEWDLKILADPEGVYGDAETINTIVKQGLEEDNPGAYQFFKDFDWTQLDVGPVIVDIHEGAEPPAAAETFVEENQQTISELLPDTGYFN